MQKQNMWNKPTEFWEDVECYLLAFNFGWNPIR